ncbi:MAG: (Fe-S)-binding protein [Chloroflexota bacterium]|nr:MAG: (Fe-S)-binding protein [Chloroflexota bacterium]
MGFTNEDDVSVKVSAPEIDRARKLREIAGYDEESDRKYREWARKKLGSPGSEKYQYPLIRGLSVDEHIDYVRQHGTMLDTNTMRKSLLGGIEVKRKKGPVQNLIKVGCTGLGVILMLRYYCLLLEKLGIDYGFLEEEYCCLSIPLYMRLSQGEDRSIVDEASREIQLAHIDEAHARGARSLAYFCQWCTIKNKWLFGDTDVNQLYYLDLLTDPKVWEGRSLRLDQTVGCYVGTTHRCGIYEPTGEVQKQVEWPEYRKLLDRVDGLKTVDIPFTCCQVSLEPIWKFARKNQLRTIVVGCNTCYGNMSRNAPPDLEIKSISQVLLEALNSATTNGTSTDAQ